MNEKLDPRERGLSFQNLFDSVPIAVGYATMDGRLIKFNKKMEEITGYPVAELTGLKATELYVDPDVRREIIEEAKKSGGISGRNARLRRKDGTEYYADISLNLISVDGTPCVQSFVQNVTEHKLAVEALEKSKQTQSDLVARLSEAQRVASLGSWEWDLDTDQVWWSDETYRIFGKKAGEYTPSFEENGKFIHPDDLDKYGKTFENSLKTDSPIDLDLRILAGDGLLKYCQVKGYIVIDSSGQKKRFVGTLMDISERKRAEESLRESQYRLELATSSAQLGIWDWDIINNKMTWDDQMYRLYGITDKASGSGIELWQRGLHPDDLAYAWDECQAALRGEKKYDIEFRVRHPDGTVKFIKADGIVLRDDNGKAVRMLGLNRDLTKQKLEEEAFGKSEALMRTAMENLPLIFYMIDNDGIFKLSIGAGLKGLGLEQNQMVGFSAFEAYKEFPEISDALHKALSGETASFESTVTGSTYFNICVPFSLPNKESSGLVAVALDTTEVKKAENALKQSEDRFRRAMENAPFPVMLHVENGDVLAISKSWTHSSGYVLEDIPTTRIWAERAHGIKKEIIQEEIDALYGLEEQTEAGEYSIMCKDGVEKYWEISSAPMGKLIDGRRAVISMAKDVTERKQAEEAIAAEKERLAVTLRSIGDGVITTDTQGNVVLMNKVAENLCGWAQAEARGKPLASVFNIINQNTRERHDNPVENVLSTGQIIELANHTLLVSRDGTERIIADSGAPIKDKDSKTIGVVLVFRDMTEKHKMLDNLQRIDKLDSLSVLAGGIAHDFNNLLGGIFGYIDLARERGSSDHVVIKYLDKALSVFDRAKDLTQQLLTFSKGGEPKRKTGHIGKLVRENADFVLSGTNIKCDYRIPQDLWLADYDENQIGQVVDNIVLNAQQAMPVGGTIVISVNNLRLDENENPMLKSGRYVKISITDTGVGIPQDLLKRIFDPFFTTKQKGNGLGLATCFSIVQKHDGYIDVESVLGKGSTFHIYLPATENGFASSNDQNTTHHQGKGRILILDDEEFMQEIVGAMLHDMGYTVIEAKNGEEALLLCAEANKEGNPIRAAFFDLTIPGGMGGKEAIVLLRKDFRDLPVFASSGFSEDPTIARPAEFGFTDSIRKPFRKSELSEILNKHLH